MERGGERGREEWKDGGMRGGRDREGGGGRREGGRGEEGGRD